VNKRDENPQTPEIEDDLVAFKKFQFRTNRQIDKENEKLITTMLECFAKGRKEKVISFLPIKSYKPNIQLFNFIIREY